jgi:5'-nucleotidase/UDP-sugar diphosphatase
MAAVPAGSGAFPQVSEGVRLAINSQTQRVERLTIQGKPVDPERTYSIATNSYLAGGGDGYKILLETLHRYDTSTFQRDVLVEYIATVRKRLKPELEGRIQITKTLNSDPLAFSILPISDSLPEILVSSHPCCAEYEIPAH